MAQRVVPALHETVDPLPTRSGETLGTRGDRAIAHVLHGQSDRVLLFAVPKIVGRARPVAVKAAPQLVAAGLALHRGGTSHWLQAVPLDEAEMSGLPKPRLRQSSFGQGVCRLRVYCPWNSPPPAATT